MWTMSPSPTHPLSTAPAWVGPWTQEELRDWFLDIPLRILLIVCVAVLLRWIVHRAINTLVGTLVARNVHDTGPIAVVDPASAGSAPTDELPIMQRSARKAARALSQSGIVDTDRQRQRVTTLGSVLRSMATVIISTIAVLMIGTEVGLNMAPVLASAGVGGVALGFGAQSLVKDFLSGMFMILEDQYGVGDLIDTGEVIGTVEEVSLRVTRVRDLNGVVWYVRNGEIVRIANQSQGWQTATVEILVAADADPERVIAILKDTVSGMESEPQWSTVLLDSPTVAGVDSITGTTMTIGIFAKVQPNEQAGIQREIRERCTVALRKAGVGGPLLVPPGFGSDPQPMPSPNKPANPQ